MDEDVSVFSDNLDLRSNDEVLTLGVEEDSYEYVKITLEPDNQTNGSQRTPLLVPNNLVEGGSATDLLAESWMVTQNANVPLRKKTSESVTALHGHRLSINQQVEMSNWSQKLSESKETLQPWAQQAYVVEVSVPVLRHVLFYYDSHHFPLTPDSSQVNRTPKCDQATAFRFCSNNKFHETAQIHLGECNDSILHPSKKQVWETSNQLSWLKVSPNMLLTPVKVSPSMLVAPINIQSDSQLTAKLKRAGKVKNCILRRERLSSDWQPVAVASVNSSLAVHAAPNRQRSHSARLKPYPCSNCHTEFDHVKHWRMHQAQRHGAEGVYQCGRCGRAFPNRSLQREHERRKRCSFKSSSIRSSCPPGKTLNGSCRQSEHEKSFMCDLCGLLLVEPRQVQRHRKHHEKKSLKWPVPEETVDQGSQQPAREQEVSLCGSDKELFCANQLYRCLVCDSSYTTVALLRLHQKLSLHGDPGKEFLCERCGQLCADLASFNQHKEVHAINQPYVCSTCGLTFAYVSNFARHNRQHFDRKPYKCDRCGALFASLTSLGVHMKRHARAPTEKLALPIKDLKSHMKDNYRTLQKQYQCQVCGHSFAILRCLQNHNRVHTLGKTQN